MSGEPVVLDGTVRARSPEQTWALLEPSLPRYGITRVARLTGLDTLGLPVFTAIRPAAQSLTATQGKGATDTLARISAVMEGIELWHAEQPRTAHTRAAARELTLPYPLAALPMKVPTYGWALDEVLLEWTYGAGLTSGRKVEVPVSVVRRQAQPSLWEPDLFRVTSTGLACGNTRDEALLHAMYEVIERDALFADESAHGTYRTLIDPATVDDLYCLRLLGQLREAGASVELAVVDNSFVMPVCLAYLWSPDYPATFAGSGCHLQPRIALARAITEAVQSRLTHIVGTRDDLPAHNDLFDTEPPGLDGTSQRPYAPWNLWPTRQGLPADLAGQATHVARRITHVTGHEPVAVDLSEPADPVAAVKVICPGTHSRRRRAVPR
ncbi:YcaO-like family protein [Streptomyces flavofungini]|uniref:YcaO-like family protein n=1 Tax=Streptomyces flavofungini TaxID=68200 RepID=UPI0025AFD744|nr:YcaO-like family protein [Streptomyces flavofungini]WJV51659.1 YcaO-like family protein [Streptomyces flavofungini]